ncbi:MAG: hypothetical protein NT154_16020 [Verrucomicrobia bacterium]|nr:hypothetical protein [Verrucomicrobiota bacterium]
MNSIAKQFFFSARSVKQLIITFSLGLLLCGPAFADLVVPSDGSDGRLYVDQNTVIDLSQAVTGTWSDNNSGNAGKGIYDPAKWAVVFKYTNVTVLSNCTVTFKNHASRAPVVWLVTGDATINGTVNLNGADYDAQPAPYLAEPGPGGFRGGAEDYAPLGKGAGFGPGGGLRDEVGSYRTGNRPYGNPSLLPLIGGSGGGAGSQYNSDYSRKGGGAGGGAILVACGRRMVINGLIISDGGRGTYGNWYSSGASHILYTYGGSGGGIRLVAAETSGGGKIEALGTSASGGGNAGGSGRIRIERTTDTSTWMVAPDPSVVPLTAGTAPLIWLPTNGPTVKVLSVNTVPVPNDPRAAFGAGGPDVTLPEVSTATVVVETVNVEAASQVFVRLTPRMNADATEVQATLQETVLEDPLTIRWRAIFAVGPGYSAVQARVVRP